MTSDVARIAEVLRRHETSIQAEKRARRLKATRRARRALWRALQAEQAALREIGFAQFSDFAAAVAHAVETAEKQRTRPDEGGRSELAVGDRVEVARAALAAAVARVAVTLEELDEDSPNVASLDLREDTDYAGSEHATTNWSRDDRRDC